jgi:hypothetical protein
LCLVIVISYHLFAPPPPAILITMPMPSLTGSKKELYRWNSINEFKMTYMGIPDFKSGGMSAIEVRAILPCTLCEDFVNITLTKNKDEAGSVNVLGKYVL